MFTQAVSFTLPRRKFTIAEYHWLGEQGFFRPGERVELIQGEMVTMAAKDTKHTMCSQHLLTILPRLVEPMFWVRCQDPITLPNDSEPEPDFAVVRVRDDYYINGHPTPNDVVFVIEIADSSLDYDREVKGSLYAQADIQHYWLFNAVDNHVEVYQQPQQGVYQYRRIFEPHESIPLPEIPEQSLPLQRIFVWV